MKTKGGTAHAIPPLRQLSVLFVSVVLFVAIVLIVTVVLIVLAILVILAVLIVAVILIVLVILIVAVILVILVVLVVFKNVHFYPSLLGSRIVYLIDGKLFTESAYCVSIFFQRGRRRL